MEFAVELGDADLAGLEDLAALASWQQPEGKSYYVAPVPTSGHPLLEGAKRAFFFKMEPCGMLHPHTDDAATAAFNTDLIVVSTNKKCRTFWQVDISTFSRRLELGKRYRMASRGLVHWAKNDGDTDCVYLLIEYPK